MIGDGELDRGVLSADCEASHRNLAHISNCGRERRAIG